MQNKTTRGKTGLSGTLPVRSHLAEPHASRVFFRIMLSRASSYPDRQFFLFFLYTRLTPTTGICTC